MSTIKYELTIKPGILPVHRHDIEKALIKNGFEVTNGGTGFDHDADGNPFPEFSDISFEMEV